MAKLSTIASLCFSASLTFGCSAADSGQGDEETAPDTSEEAFANAPVIEVTNKTWHCKGPQDHTVVKVTIDTPDQHMDAVHLDEGCTGRLKVVVVTNSADGIKVHQGAHDLVVTGSVLCTEKFGKVHQDGVQAMGGTRIQFGNGKKPGSFKVDCATGNNGGLYVNEGNGGHGLPEDIVCDHCDLYEGNVAMHIANSIRSGARNSILHLGTGGASPKEKCTRISPMAVDPIDQNNTCI